MKFTFFFVVCVFIVPQLTAQTTPQLNTITTAVPFLIIAPDARSSGMGNAGAATSPDAYALHWNTSKLAFSEKKVEISASYTPWLRSLVDDNHLLHLSGNTKLGARHTVGGSVTYFDLGEIIFTDDQGNLIRQFNPNEFEFVGAYAFRLSERSAIGINAKYIYSNLTNGNSVGSIATKAGQSIASDISYSYFNNDLSLTRFDASWSYGVTISNLGNKMSYTTEVNRDFLPANLRLGSALKVDLNENHSITAAADFNKLLVPTSPIMDNNGFVLSGRSTNVSSVIGVFQSFYDAPGIILSNNGGVVEIEKNSKLKEELNEITIGGGLEYQFKEQYTFRSGYFYQHQSKGGQQYLTLGLGLKYKVIGLDISYLNGLNKASNLTNTMRFSLNFAI